MKYIKNYRDFVNESKSTVINEKVNRGLVNVITKSKVILVFGRKSDSSSEYTPIEIKRGSGAFDSIVDILNNLTEDDLKESVNSGAPVSDVNEGKIKGNEEVNKVIDDIVGVGYKKYQINSFVYQGKYCFTLPDMGVKLDMLKKLVNIMPEGSTLGYYSNYGSGLMIKSNIDA